MSKTAKTVAVVGAGGLGALLGGLAGCESWLSPPVHRPPAVIETASQLGVPITEGNRPSIDEAEEEVAFLEHRLVQTAEDAEFVIARYDAAVSEAREVFEQRRAMLDSVLGDLMPIIQSVGEEIPGGSSIITALGAIGLIGSGLTITGPGQVRKKDAEKRIQEEREKARKEGVNEGAAIARGSQ